MDVLYILGNGSKWDDNELRFSLRSIEKNLIGLGNVYIVGRLPHFIQGVHHVEMKDESGVCKQYNIMRKIYEGTKISELSSNFIFINDDHFLLHPLKVEAMQYWYDGTMLDRFRLTNYVRYANCIHHVIDELGDGPYFDIHTPIVYNRTLFRDVMDRFDWNKENTYVVKSLYCNWLQIEGVQMDDNKRDFPDWRSALKQNEGRTWFSTTDHVSSGVKNYLQHLFPERSRFEIG